MNQQIEAFSDASVVVAGERLPVPGIVEDESGVRLLLLDRPASSSEVWARAIALGAQIIVVLGETWRWGLIGVPAAPGVPSVLVLEKTEETSYDGLMEVVPPERLDYILLQHAKPPARPTNGFVHLHAHSEYSALDGLSKIEEMVNAVVEDGAEALGLTDHGICAGHPELQEQTEKAGINPVFGTEAYFVDDRRVHTPGPKPKKDAPEEEHAAWAVAYERSNSYWHLVLLAENDIGLHNIWAASTEANREGFYKHPRMDWDTLARHSEGVICSTGCLRGPIASALLADDWDLARMRLGRLLDTYGEKVYLELGTNQLDMQKKVNEGLVVLGYEHSVPLLSVVDSHYPCHDDHSTHKIWIAAQTNKDLQDEADLFAGAEQYHLLTASEVRNALDYLPPSAVSESMANSVAIARSCTARLKPRTTFAPFSKVGGKDADVARLVDMCIEAWPKKIGDKPNMDVYAARFEREMKLLIDKDFVWYYLVVADYVNHCRHNGKIIGPGRGSGAGSIVAYLSGITGIDPIEYDLMFERFITEGRTALPDFDVDFPASVRDFIQDYVAEKYGHDHVVRVGTVTRLRNKGVISKMKQLLAPDAPFMEFKKISEIITAAEGNSAGLGIPWDDLWAEHGDVLDPYRAEYPEVFDAADKLVGRISTYGRHAAGWAISLDEPLDGELPMRRGEEGSPHMVAEFPMDAFEFLNIPKFDLLTLRTLDTIQNAIDLVYDLRGIRIDPGEWRDEYLDPDVWQMLCDGKTKGVFQIETKDGTRLTKRFGPRSIRDLADITTLVRPGPSRSGLTESYMRRREGAEEVTLVDERLAAVLAPTWGTMIYQEQIMATCQLLGGYTLSEADTVRSILGKKKVEKVEKEGQKFIPAVVERGMTQEAAEHLWGQMGEFARYSFNLSHAVSYAVLAYWCAWLKYHYPAEFMTALLSTVKKERIPEFVREARLLGFPVLPPDINASGRGFTVNSDGEIRYGLDGIMNIGDATVNAVVQGQPYVNFDDFVARSGCDWGATKLFARVGAFDSLGHNRKALESQIEWTTSGMIDKCVSWDPSASGPNALPCTYNWEGEPVALGKSGRPLKAKAPPKKCTKACRRYDRRPARSFDGVEPYSDSEIRQIEGELLGIHLSSTEFDRIPPHIIAEFTKGSDLEVGLAGTYQIAAIITGLRQIYDRNGKAMAFITMLVQDVEVDVTCFKNQWLKYKPDLAAGLLCFAVVGKNDRGYTLIEYAPVPS